METIYLVGQISPKFKETYEWRKRVREYFSKKTYVKVVGDMTIPFYKRSEIEIIDPCCNPFNQKLLQEKDYAINDGNKTFGVEVLPSKDLTYILQSSIAIVNLNQYDPNKELLGSYFEMAWLYLYPEKTVIAFADNIEGYNCKHPFVSQTVDVWCKDEKEACNLIDNYFINLEI